MDWRSLLHDTSRLLGNIAPNIDSNVDGIEIELDGFPMLAVEKVPGLDFLALSGILCHYPDRERLFRLFEGLMNAHAFGIHTNNAYFAANSSLGQVFMHKLLPFDALAVETLRNEIEVFANTLKRWSEACANGEIFGLTEASASEGGETPHDAIRA